MKLTQEELDILENAPKGATHWMTHNYHDNDYAIFDVSVYKVASDTLKWFMMSEWAAAPLADLRKRKEQEDKQKIVDAVNYFKGEFPFRRDFSHSADQVLVKCKKLGASPDRDVGDIFAAFEGFNSYYHELICTAKEFNQCVKEMSEHKGHNEFTRHQEWPSYSKQNGTPTKLEPEQKPVDDSKAITMLYMMAGYLTSMEKPITFSSKHWATPAADIVAEFIKANNLQGDADFDNTVGIGDFVPNEPLINEPVEWVNGDECLFNGHSYIFIGKSIKTSKVAIVERTIGCTVETDRIWISELSKPVTKEKRYVSFDKHGKFINETNGDGAASPDWQTFVVEVNV